METANWSRLKQTGPMESDGDSPLLVQWRGRLNKLVKWRGRLSPMETANWSNREAG